MSAPRTALVAVAATITAFVGCYHGTNNVPHQTGGSGGAGGGATTGFGATSTTGSSSAGSAGSTTSGTPGTGGAIGDAGVDPCTTALLCDDFESYAVGSPPGGKWGNNQSGGTVAVDSTHVHSGTKAVKMSAAATTTGYRSVMIKLTDASLLPTSTGVVYGRMMFWLDSAPDTSVHWTFIDGSGPVPGQSYHSIYRYGGQTPLMSGATFTGNQLMANYDTPDSYDTPPVGPSSDCWLHANTEVVPVTTWTCAEWMFDTATNTMHFWQNGTAFTDLTMTGLGQGCVHQDAGFEWLAPTIQEIDVGWESYQNDDARNIWIDDVAIDTKRIGCPQ